MGILVCVLADLGTKNGHHIPPHAHNALKRREPDKRNSAK